MSSALFIHHDQSFLDRVQTEARNVHISGATAEPIFASSLVQGLRFISNPDVALSGIFFDPTDTSYSALRFIELTLLQRPATPLFVVHQDAGAGITPYQSLIKNNHLQGFFTGNESYTVLTKSIDPEKILKNLKRKASPKGLHQGFIAVPVIDFIQSGIYPFNVFIESDEKGLSLFAVANSEIEPEYLLHAADATAWLYVDETEISKIREGIRDTQLNFMSMDSFPPLWKTAEVLFNAKTLLNEMHRSGLSDQLVEQTLFMLGDVFQLVSVMSLETGNAKLNYFMAQAKACDQTVASATLSILMCKALKFERNAVLEILGLASLLQDVALYNSPFGDLSKTKQQELAPDALAYYSQHPLISADLVAQNTSVPDVALQVIRQQHERKDKTGYPNRIGGMQLQPMAEVLSLINSYLDISRESPHLISAAIFQKLAIEVFPHYSDRTVTAFKSILENFLNPIRASA